MELNIITFTYLFLRLAPFVLVSFFSLASIFNQDFKGLVYLVGLLFSCFIVIFIGNVTTSYIPGTLDKQGICTMITLNQGGEITTLPLGQAVFGYTFFYLIFTIVNPGEKYNFVKQNIPTLIFFPLLILFDIVWNIRNSCYSIWQLLASLIISSALGWLWAYIISLTNSKNLQYFADVNNKEVCSKPSESTFKCAVYKNGQIISTNFSTPKY
jgi:hypothetical protein